jgi:hypothetical protein
VFPKIVKSGWRGRGTAANSGAPGEADRRLLRPELAGVLDDNDWPRRAPIRGSRSRGEIALLDRLVPDERRPSPSAKTLLFYLVKVARLGGYLARAKDPPTGTMVVGRGLSRLTDITLGAQVAHLVPKCG